MFRLRTLLPIALLVGLVSTMVGCGSLPGGGGGPTSAAPGSGAPTAAPAVPTVPFAATATSPVVAATDAAPRVAPTATSTPSADPASLAASASPICDAAYSKPVPALQNLGAPESPVLFMINKEYEGRTFAYYGITSIRGYATDARNVRSVMCIVETRKKTDQYPDGSPVYQVTWEGRFLKWPEGTVLRVRPNMVGSQIFTTFPKPAGTEFYGGRPEVELGAFVKEALGN